MFRNDLILFIQIRNCLNFSLNFKLVLAEPLEEDSDSHVQHFLDSHGGPGLQHIGLTAPNVSKTVEWMYEKGAQFRMPPPTYYQLVIVSPQ